jgi:dihydroxyacid dehydratase/phosphogluconate dehydratase
MDDNDTSPKRPLRSARWFRKDDLPGFVHRSTLAAAGWSREDLMTRPVIGILNTWSDMNPCNPRHLLERGVSDMLRISDARMSGTAYGAAVLHVSPEAAVGGPLALVRDGDVIELDVAERRLQLCVDANELERRRQVWQPPASAHARGYRRLYDQHVEQAHRGCDFDFLRGANAETLPEGLFDGWVGGW